MIETAKYIEPLEILDEQTQLLKEEDLAFFLFEIDGMFINKIAVKYNITVNQVINIFDEKQNNMSLLIGKMIDQTFDSMVLSGELYDT